MASPNASDAPHVHGPVDSLTDHLSDEWWQELFDATYLLTDADVLSDRITSQEVDVFVERAALTPDDRILDLCCGQGRHTLELARRGFEHVQGFDNSEYLIDVARKRAADEGLDVPFEVGDARALPFEDSSFDAVLLLGNSFGYFDETDGDRALLSEVHRILSDSGRVLVDLTDGDHMRKHYEARSWEWADEEHLVCRERELTEADRRLVAREILVDTDDGVEEDQFYAERLYGRRQMHQLLREAGFGDLRFSSFEGASERGQDLGMMGHRFVVTASRSAPDSSDGPEAPVTPSRNAPHYVAVALGDPRRSDETKQGGTFGELDFDTVQRLKDALQSLPNLECIFFNDHETLVDDLRTYGDAVDLVFNLCDEGLRNEPRQELHVPAMLDAFEIPYTGAGPQCLASCYDKSMIRGVAREMDIPVPNGLFLRPNAPIPEEIALSFPVIVKPNAADNSAGMTRDCIAETPKALDRAIRSVREHVGPERALLVEEFLTGADLTLGMIGNPGDDLDLLPISEDDYSALPDHLPRFCGYEAKWEPDSPYWQDVEAAPASLPDETATQIQNDSTLLFDRLGCRDYARFDWRLDANGQPHLLEANPNPGWSWDSHLVEAAAFEGRSYPETLQALLAAAFKRHPTLEPLA